MTRCDPKPKLKSKLQSPPREVLGVVASSCLLLTHWLENIWVSCSTALFPPVWASCLYCGHTVHKPAS